VRAAATTNGAALPFAKATFALSVHDPRELPPRRCFWHLTTPDTVTGQLP